MKKKAVRPAKKKKKVKSPVKEEGNSSCKKEKSHTFS